MQSMCASSGKKPWFGNDLKIDFRPIRHEDAGWLNEFFKSHSKATILHRYFAPLLELSPEQIRKFVDLDYEKDMAIIGLVPFQDRERILCVGRFFRDSKGNSAEIAITVHDDFQGRGIGTFLLRALIRIARAYGIAELTADVLAENNAMMCVLHKCSHKLSIDLSASVYHVVLPIEPISPMSSTQFDKKAGKKAKDVSKGG
jgi:GNAT superfamily N-acetyltransferase